MSLDVYLTTTDFHEFNTEKIYIRENGSKKQISREEWDERFPGREPVVISKYDIYDDKAELYSANITHNLNKMATEAGIYYELWQPETKNILKAKQLIDPLTKGLEVLKSDPERFKKFNPANGWGCYENLVSFVEQYLNACKEYPNADVYASR